MTAAEQLHAALRLTVDKRGHLSERCSHGHWLRGWDNRTSHECDVPDCDKTGAPCTSTCQAVRAALREPAQERLL